MIFTPNVGHGVGAEFLDHIGLKYHTSKITSFEDISNISSFGFRYAIH